MKAVENLIIKVEWKRLAAWLYKNVSIDDRKSLNLPFRV